jgi:hypothetical protein
MQPISDELDARITKLEHELVRLKAAKLEKLARPMQPKPYPRWASELPRNIHFGDSHYVVVSNKAGFRVMGPSSGTEWSAIKLWNEGIDHV